MSRKLFTLSTISLFVLGLGCGGYTTELESGITQQQDRISECGGFDCSGWHFGFVGDTCFYEDDVSDTVAACDGFGACQTRAQLCPDVDQAGGPSPVTCDAVCQQPDPSSCLDLAPGVCQNVDAGTITSIDLQVQAGWGAWDLEDRPVYCILDCQVKGAIQAVALVLQQDCVGDHIAGIDMPDVRIGAG